MHAEDEDAPGQKEDDELLMGSSDSLEGYESEEAEGTDEESGGAEDKNDVESADDDSGSHVEDSEDEAGSASSDEEGFSGASSEESDGEAIGGPEGEHHTTMSFPGAALLAFSRFCRVICSFSSLL